MLSRSSPQFAAAVKRGTNAAPPFLPILPKNESPTPSDLGYSSPTHPVPQDSMLLSPSGITLPPSSSLASSLTPSLTNGLSNSLSSLHSSNLASGNLQSSLQTTLQNSLQTSIQNSIQTLKNYPYHPLSSLILAAQLHPQLPPLNPQYSFLSLSMNQSLVSKQNGEEGAAAENQEENNNKADLQVIPNDSSSSSKYPGTYEPAPYSNREEDDDEREPGELVIKEDPSEDEEGETGSANVSSSANFENRRASYFADAALASSHLSRYDIKPDVDRMTLDRLAAHERAMAAVSAGPTSPAVSRSPPVGALPHSISSLHSVLDSVNSSLTRNQFEQTVAGASDLLNSPNIGSDLRCPLCGIYSNSRIEALHHSQKLCPFLIQVSSAQEGLQNVLINGLASKLQSMASTSAAAGLPQSYAQHYPAMQHYQTMKYSPRSSYKDEESGSDADIMGNNGQLVADADENSRDGRKVRSRSHIRGEHLNILRPIYLSNPRPKKEEIIAIADRLNFPARVVQVWFQNARARDRREGRAIPAHPKSSCSSSLGQGLCNTDDGMYSVASNSLLNLRAAYGEVSSQHSYGNNIANNIEVSIPAISSVSPALTTSVVTSSAQQPNSYPSLLNSIQQGEGMYTSPSSHSGIGSPAIVADDAQDSMPLDLSTKRQISPESNNDSLKTALNKLPALSEITSPSASSTGTQSPSIVSSHSPPAREVHQVSDVTYSSPSFKRVEAHKDSVSFTAVSSSSSVPFPSQNQFPSMPVSTQQEDSPSKLAQILQNAKLGIPTAMYAGENNERSEKRLRVSKNHHNCNLTSWPY